MITIGGGGAGGYNDPFSPAVGGNGGSSSLSNSSFTSVSSSGGIAPGPYDASGGASGGGTAGGSNVAYTDNAKIATYATAWGGGGGNTTGGNGSVNPANYTGQPTGGTGGSAFYSSVYNLNVGAGGGGGANSFNGTTPIRGSSPSCSYGGGGAGVVIKDVGITTYSTAGQSGYVAFKYYGP